MKLSNISAEYTLVLFWASWCRHCESLLSVLKEIYEYHDKGLEIVTISIDKDRKEWQNTISNEQYRWINYSEWEARLHRLWRMVYSKDVSAGQG